MLPKKVELIDEADLDQMCVENWPESQTLDFKMEIPGTKPEHRLEIAKDLCAFANSDGGVLIYGIAEATGGAGKVKPITGESFDQAQRRIRSVVDSKIEPRLQGLQFLEVRVRGGYVLIIQVPSS